MVREFKSEDKGKKVVTADGDMVGTVEEASGTAARVKAEEDLSRSIRRRLGWSEEDEESFELEHSNVERISGDEIRLKRNP